MVLLGLGSNLSSSFGDRFENLNLATVYLKEYKIKIIKRSSFYETPSWPNNKYPKFINSVVKIETKLNPLKLFILIKKIEALLGRKTNKKNHPRTCDIDIIDFNGQIINKKILKIPHKKLHQRNFVLIPLYEICRNWVHPVTGKNISNLLNNLSNYNLQSIKLI